MDVLPKVLIEYFIEASVPVVIERIIAFTKAIATDQRDPEKLPSAAIIGVGRCGSNISILVADICAKSVQLQEDAKKKGQFDIDIISRWIFAKRKGIEGISYVNPVIMVADLDENTYTRLESLTDSYGKLRSLDQIRYLNLGGGTGNLPILGQYMGRVMLNIKAENAIPEFKSKEWMINRNYLVDSVGTHVNDSHLFFYVFSTGGGSGSGIAPEFGLAQQYAYALKIKQARDNKDGTYNRDKNPTNMLRFQPICSIGIGVLPTIEDGRGNNAVYLNSGRTLCRYLAQQWRFKNFFSNDNFTPITVRTFNGLILVSNDVMKWHYKEVTKKPGEIISANNVQQLTNDYIAQQIFNLLSAQALTRETKNLLDGIDPGETIRLDANDLNNSLVGPMVVAYAEAPSSGKIDIGDLIYRALSVPKKNQDTGYLEGISVLPQSKQKYDEKLKDAKNKIDALSDISLFRCADAVVTVISVPEKYNLEAKDVAEIRETLYRLFPNANIRRYSLVKGAIERSISISILISGSACTCSEILEHILTYIDSCFIPATLNNNDIINSILKGLRDHTLDLELLAKSLSEFEDLAPVIAGGNGAWEVIKATNEANYNTILGPDSFTPIDNVRITRDDIMHALAYVDSTLKHGQRSRVEVSDI